MRKTKSVDLIEKSVLLEVLDRLLEKHDLAGLEVFFELFPEIYGMMAEDVKDVEFMLAKIAFERLKQQLIGDRVWRYEA